MNNVLLMLRLVSFLIVACLFLVQQGRSQTLEDKQIPELLNDWKDWATWSELPSSVPSSYQDSSRKLSVWPSMLDLDVDEKSGRFTMEVEVFHETWVTLPGNREAWPLRVEANGEEVAVLSRANLPSIRLSAGIWEVSGAFRWADMPQFVTIPASIGVLQLSLNGKMVSSPTWGASGQLWLKRSNKATADKNFLSAQVYRNLKDGSPMWLYTDVELTVTGKSREEVLGSILPEGWKISSLNAPIPCAVDDQGLLKSQVRAGKWIISISAYSTNPIEEIRYREGVKPVVAEELISLQNEPGFRLIEFTGIPAVDVAQTTFPDKWKSLPLHQWGTSEPFQILEKMRGMGQKKPPGLKMQREFWLDEDGKQLTYRDVITGMSLQTWRLDAAEGQKLGAAKIDNQSQLITLNPFTGAAGLEVRVRNLSLQAVGRMDQQAKISATGWKSDAEKLMGSLHLPPGWRLFAIWGPDWSEGDWLTSWSLLDIFFLLIFTVVIFRLWDWKMAAIAFAAFVLSYHEPRAPRFVWIILLCALVLYRAVPVGRWKTISKVLCYVVAGFLLMGLVPFVTKQTQQMLYPQLEPHTVVGTYDYGMGFAEEENAIADNRYLDKERLEKSSFSRQEKVKFEKQMLKMKNLSQDSKAKIQTGPAVPEWSWRTIRFGWSGPVSANENISLVLIPLWLQRFLIIARVCLLLALLYLLLRSLGKHGLFKNENTGGSRASMIRKNASTAIVAISLALFSLPSTSHAQFPSKDMLEQLRERLADKDDGLSQFAEIPQVSLQLDGRRLSMDVEVHTAKKTAVPLPGRLPVWSPLTVRVEGMESVPIARHDGFLWVVLDKGTHRVTVDGLVPAGDWEWSFQLKPQYVSINAPNWTVSGVRPNGSPENQVFFAEQNKASGTEAAYDRKDFNPILKVDRSLELGLIWQARTTVRRLSPLGKAVSISLPLLPGERILSPGFTEKNGRMEIRLGAQQSAVSWESELVQSPNLKLEAEKNESWVEEWRVTASSVWNLSLNGLEPVFDHGNTNLVPFWRPWPGEMIELNISRPEAVAGETMTIRQARHEIKLGARQRSSSLELNVQTSLGSDFVIGLPANAQVTSLKLRGKETPVRKDGDQVIIPLRPGEQKIDLSWKTSKGLTFTTVGDQVKLPVDCANTSTVVKLSSNDRWVLWATGPQRGPAVRMWGIFIVTLLFGWMLGRLSFSPLKSYEWMLLLLGVTQVPFYAGFFVVGWMFWLVFRGRYAQRVLPNGVFNFNQVLIVCSILPLVLILLGVLHQGLLGSPEMRIVGENSSKGRLIWFQARGESQYLPVVHVYSVSIWLYRGLMLIWAVWLAFAVLRWVRWAWTQFGEGGFWKKSIKKVMPEETTDAPSFEEVN